MMLMAFNQSYDSLLISYSKLSETSKDKKQDFLKKILIKKSKKKAIIIVDLENKEYLFENLMDNFSLIFSHQAKRLIMIRNSSNKMFETITTIHNIFEISQKYK